MNNQSENIFSPYCAERSYQRKKKKKKEPPSRLLTTTRAAPKIEEEVTAYHKS